MQIETRNRSRLVRLVALHLLVLGLLVFLCWWGCPFYRLAHIRCPGCGLTRAWLRFLQGDLQGALAYHALFLPVPLFLFLLVYRDSLFRKKKRILDPFLYLFAFLMVVYHVVRSWP